MKKLYYIILFFLSIFTINVCYSKEINTKLMGKKIILDVGHGGVDGGSVVSGIFEKDINLQIAIKLRDELIKNGVDVVMVRDDDFDLSSPYIDRRKKSDFDNRINLINNSNADLYLSIHCNYLDDSRYYGAQTFYTNGNEVLSMIMQESFKSHLKSPLEAKMLGNNIYMYKRLEVPGVLIECGFLSNKKERNLLLTNKYQDLLVSSIVKALISFY